MVFLLIVFFIKGLFAQSSPQMVSLPFKSDITIVDNVSLPRFDVHLAAGLVSGGRLGFRYLFINNFSVEIAYGAAIENFIGLTEPKTKYTVGFNYHFSNSIAIISILSTYVERPNPDSDVILVSPNFGFIKIRKPGLQVFIRAGINIEFQKSYPSKNWEVGDFGGNIDVGVALNF
ncbi:MAG: hypothetical protein DRQ13_02560 [Ignavibacteriae bacterium]|nr:MAG: hypothetical protein DRQ13_02560 [Ignavibacteriota bacterium]